MDEDFCILCQQPLSSDEETFFLGEYESDDEFSILAWICDKCGGKLKYGD